LISPVYKILKTGQDRNGGVLPKQKGDFVVDFFLVLLSPVFQPSDTMLF
jgi:hypothetical protein